MTDPQDMMRPKTIVWFEIVAIGGYAWAWLSSRYFDGFDLLHSLEIAALIALVLAVSRLRQMWAFWLFSALQLGNLFVYLGVLVWPGLIEVNPYEFAGAYAVSSIGSLLELVLLWHPKTRNWLKASQSESEKHA